MSNVIELIFVFVIVLVGGFFALSSLANTSSIAMGNCAYNDSGSLVNCSLSNRDYQMLNATQSNYVLVFNTFTPVTYVLPIAVLCAIFLTFVAVVKK